MPKKTSALSVTAAQAAAFRLSRHHLGAGTKDGPRTREGPRTKDGPGTKHQGPGTTLIEICRDTGGIQAQVMSAAEMALWTRRRSTTRAEIQAALFERRDIVRTSAMRLTLHLIPARDLSMVIAALRPMSTATLQRWHQRMGAKPDHVKGLVDTIVESLSDGPRTQQELIARAKKKAGKGVRAWLDHAWSAVRPAVIDGLIVYGPPRGAEATFVRVDTWLPTQPPCDAAEARAELLRRFLSAFGPASAHDFAKWSGLKTSDARTALDGLREEAVQVSVDGAPGWIRSADLNALRRSALDEDAVQLLGAFDSFLLAHATKEHLVAPQHYKQVYRPQGWISPVVLRGGAIVGVWFPKTAGRTMRLDVELFGRATPAVRQAIERDAEAMGRFLGAACSARFR
jgi:uncharacterized protein YcaQ